MRILVISNLYPPYYVGGYDLGCRDVVEGLKSRGHEIKVLTSTYGVETPQSDGEVYRWLRVDLEPGKYLSRRYLFKLLKKEILNQNAFKRMCKIFKPDIIYAWNLTHISVSLAFIAQKMSLPVCYFVFDNWFSHWESDHWYSMWHHQSFFPIRRIIWKIAGFLLNVLNLLTPRGSLELRYVQFASQYLKKVALQKGKGKTDAKVIYWGVDATRYPYKENVCNSKHLLYVGQVVPHKGIHTAIEALNLLIQLYGYKSLTLTIVGGTVKFLDYRNYVVSLARSFDLEGKVSFVGQIPRESLLPIYQEHDILIFPSVWEEPFGITLLEAMSSGLAIVGTATGGSAEILQHEINALIFPKEDSAACAYQISRLIDNPDLFKRIRENGRRTVEEKFNFQGIMDKIEGSLYEIFDSKCYKT